MRWCGYSKGGIYFGIVSWKVLAGGSEIFFIRKIFFEMLHVVWILDLTGIIV